MEISALKDFDNVFYWDKNDIATANQSELMAGLLQPSRTMFYGREWGAGISGYENSPVSINNLIEMKYNIMQFVIKRNSQVTAGDDGYKDRRIITSQDVIDIQNDDVNGNITVKVEYYNLFDAKLRETKANLGNYGG